MNVVEIPIEKLVPYVNNPRVNDDSVPMVAESLKRFGWQQPVVVDKDMVIVIGHTRTKAAEMIGMKSVPCVIADDLTEDEIRALRVVDNKTAEFAEWDEELLGSEVKELMDCGYDLIDDFFGKKVAELVAEEESEVDYDEDGAFCECPRCKYKGETYEFMNDADVTDEEGFEI